jgi:O-antigen/teichoic acid export membrane protein
MRVLAAGCLVRRAPPAAAPRRMSSATVAVEERPRRARLLSSGAVVVIRLLSIASGLAFVKGYTGALSISEVGRFFYLSTLSYALNALVFVPVDFYMQARLAKEVSIPVHGTVALVWKVLALALVACLALSAPLLWFDKLQWLDLPALYAVAALLYLCTTLRNLLNNRGATIFVSSMLLLESVGRLGAFLAMVLLMGASARVLMVSSALALFVEFLIVLVRARRTLPLAHGTEPLDTAATMVRVAAPLAGSAVCNALQLQTYRVAYPMADVGVSSGIYGVVSNVGAAAMAACASIYQQLQQPQLYQSQGASIGRYVRRAALMSAGVFVVLVVFAPFFVRLLTKDQYVAYSSIIGFGVVQEACNLVMGAYAVLLSLRQRTDVLLKLNLLAASLSVAGCLGVLAWSPGNPYLIGLPIAGSQLLLTLATVAYAARRQLSHP